MTAAATGWNAPLHPKYTTDDLESVVENLMGAALLSGPTAGIHVAAHKDEVQKLSGEAKKLEEEFNDVWPKAAPVLSASANFT